MTKLFDPEEPGAYYDEIGDLDIHKKYRYGDYKGLYITDDEGMVDAWFYDEESALKAARLIVEYFQKEGNKNE